MVEHAQLMAVVHQSVATSKELAEALQEEIAQSKDGNVTMTALKAQMIASQLRITANLVSGLIEENSQIMDRVHELSERLTK